jgi:hypothetical protein
MVYVWVMWMLMYHLGMHMYVVMRFRTIPSEFVNMLIVLIMSMVIRMLQQPMHSYVQTTACKPA